MLCRWDASDGSRTVLLESTAVEQLRASAAGSLPAVPRRGAETGGLLLGHFDAENDRVVWIERIEEIPSEHRYGPAYVLSDDDRSRLSAAVRHDNSGLVVGLFRTYAGREPAIDAADEDLILTHFRDRRMAFLLIRPLTAAESTAAFLFWNREELAATPSQPWFRLDPAALEIRTAFEPAEPVPALAEPPLDSGPEPASPAAAGPEPENASVPISAASALDPENASVPISISTGPELDFVPSYASRRRDYEDDYEIEPQPVTRRRRHAFWPAVAACVVIAISAAFVYELWKMAHEPRWIPLHMSAVRDQFGLHVKWDRSLAAVQRASRGVLRISDGPTERNIDLGPDAIRAGLFAYEPVHPDVRFRLELSEGLVAAVGDSLQVVGLPAPAAPAAQPAIARAPAPAPAPVPAEPSRPRERPVVARPSVASADRVQAPPANTPLEAVHEVQPDISSGIRARISGRIVVPVEVTVNASGKVTRAVARGEGDGLYRYLAARAQRAAYLWRFRPPRGKNARRDGAVTTEIRFVFTR